MKRFCFITFFIFILLFSSISKEAFAEENEDPRVQKIASFLEEFDLIKDCLKNRKNQEDKPLTNIVAACAVLRVFDGRQPSLSKAWQKAKNLHILEPDQKQSSQMRGIDYLKLLFTSAGVTISPISENSFQTVFKKIRIKGKEEEKKTLATAMEQGLFLLPQSQKEIKEFQNKLWKRPFTISAAFAYLYQVATSQHKDIAITVSPINTSLPELTLEEILKEVVGIIKTQSYYSDKFNEKKAMEEAVKAIVKTMKEDDQYIEYFSEEEFNSFSQNLDGNLEGIGAYIELKEDHIIIVSPISGSPAEKAGLQPEDIILKVNGEKTLGLNLQQVVDKIRGPKGTTVILTIERNNTNFDVSIIREKISVPALTVSSKDGFEIIKISQFSSSSAQEMQTELSNINDKNPKGIIIDLRNNPGGFLNEVVTIADFFIQKDQPIVVLKDRDKETQMLSMLNPLVKNIPIAVLINKGSASASEILAGVLQNYGIAKIYGETSFGKGTVQNVITLRDPVLLSISGFKLTTSEYLIGSPDKKPPISINNIGVRPKDNPGGESIPLTDDKKTPNDEALDAVLKLMK